MSIINSLLQSIGEPQLEKLGRKIGLSEAQTKKAIQLLIPLLLSAMNKNVSTKDGANSLFDALDQHTSTPDINNIDEEDGKNILSHILGDRLDRVEEKTSETTGLGASQINSLLKNIAPVLLGQLGQQKASGSLDLGGLLDALSGADDEIKSDSNPIGGLITGLLDTDGDGNYKDDLLEKGAGMLMGKIFGSKS